MVEVVRGVDRTLFEDYVKPKVSHLTALVRKGVLGSGVDWFETPRPTEVRQYIHEILISLVAIHAQVSATSRALLERTLAAIIVEIVNDALQCFRQISKFGMGGMLRVCPHAYHPSRCVPNDLSRRRWRLSLCTKQLFNTSINRQAIPSRRYTPLSRSRINVVLVPMETYKENSIGSNELCTKRGELPRSNTYASRHLGKRETTTPLEVPRKRRQRHNMAFIIWRSIDLFKPVAKLLVYSEYRCTTGLYTP